MEIRNITPNDLPVLKNLVGTDDFTDICYEYSKISINDDGEITSFVISTPKSIKDYLGEVIPLELQENAKHISKVSKDALHDFFKIVDKNKATN